MGARNSPARRSAALLVGAASIAILGTFLTLVVRFAPPAPRIFSADERAIVAKRTCRDRAIARLHDPRSAEIDSEAVSATPDGFAVVVRLRARNAYNAVRVVTFACSTDPDGLVVRSLSTLP